MRRTTRRPALTAALALLVAGLLVVPAGASAFADRDHPLAASSDAGAALAQQAATSAPHHHDASDFQNSILEAAHESLEADGPLGRSTLPTGFSDQVAITGMSEAVSADFAPDGTAFIALKTGQIKVADYNSTTRTWATVTDFADLQTEVDNYGDRGLTGIAVDPQFPTRPYVYANYTYDKDPRDGAGGTVPKWGTGSAYDDCPHPATEADPSIAGCLVQDRVVRLTATHASGSWRVVTPLSAGEKELMVSGCYQFSSHASGDVAFGPDGKLYASSGEGASFNTQDYGQYANACGDPTDEGGSLRSQDYRSSSDALGVDGSVVKMDPDTGVVPTQGTAASWLVAYGQRNPWRLAFRPKADGTGLTKELWSVDVGASKAEEINRVPDVTSTSPPATLINRGWPCYEGSYVASAVQPAWDALNKPLCESLYAQGVSAVQKPVFSYQTRDGGPLVTGEDCANETSAMSGVAFATSFGTAQSNYPEPYKGALFFADYARSCIWALGKDGTGEPDPSVIRNVVQAASTPTDLLIGPGGDLYYVDYGLTAEGAVDPGHAAIHRIVYTAGNAVPTARITTPGAFSGPAPLTVQLSGATSTDPDGDTLTYRWDWTNDGTWDATGVSVSHQYAVGTYTVKLEVDDGHGHTATATQQIQAGNSAPVLGTVTPTSALTWAAGDTISFSATATDAQQGAMPSSAFTWQMQILHCPSGVCHTHPFGTFASASGTVTAPPHEYPSKLLLQVTVTDSGGLTDTQTIQLDPKTVDLTFASSPTGAGVTVGENAATAPHTETFIQGAPVTVSAATTTGTGAAVAAFSSWSDGGARSHTITPPATAATYTATYTRPTAGLSASPTSGPAPLSVTYTASGTNAPGASGGFTYAWDLDNDGAFDDGTGATQSPTYATSGARTVRVLVTDSRGATDAASTTVNVGPPNQAPVPAIAATPTSGPAPLPVTLSASGSTDPDGDPLTYAWDTDNNGVFDNGTGLSVSTTYTGVGPHTATVKVSDNRGGSATKSTVVTVTNRPPTAAVAATPASGPAPLSVQLTAAGSADPDGTALSYAWDLDNDGQYDDATGLTTPTTVNGVGPHTFGVKVTDADGGTATASTFSTVTNRLPTVAIAATPTSGPAPLVVSLSAAGSSDPDGTALTYAWDLDGDGQYDDATGLTTSTTVNGVGAHALAVRVTDADGGSATRSTSVTVTNRLPTAAVAASPSSGPAPLVVALSAAGSSDPDGTALTYAWDLDADGQYDDATGLTTSTTLNGVGAHTVGVKVTDADGGTATKSASVSVTNRAPTAAIAANPSSGGAPLVPTFSAAGSADPDGTALSYAWDLDDDGQYDDATGITASRSYSAVGPHVVGVQVKDADNGTATASTTVTVTNTGPTARITTTPNPATGNAPFHVTFNGTTSTDPDGGALTYAWDLDGNGTFEVANAPTPPEQVYGVGNVTVSLKVTDDGGLSSTATVPVTVPNRAPVPAVSADPTSGPAPLHVSLSAAGSSDPDGDPLTYAWDTDADGQFDDGTGLSTTATYSGVGSHTATVKVTDNHGGATTKAVTVTVTNTGPVAHIVTNPPTGTGAAPLTVGFDASTSLDPDGGPLIYAWDLDGDGAYDDATGATALSTYQVGTTTVALKVTDVDGTSATTTAVVTATDTAPTVTRVTTYPSGGYYVGQTLGFDAAATDPQQDLPDAAYSFVMLRQDCDGCARVEVQRWEHVSAGQYLVPSLPPGTRLYLVANVIDGQGAVGTRELRLDPGLATLTLRARPGGLTVDGSVQVVVGTTVRVSAPKKQVKKGVRWVFVRWSAGGARMHDVTVWDSGLRLTAVYQRKR